MYIVMLGPPGAGKGTQSAVISQELGLTHLSSGDLFRQAVARDDELGKKVKDFLDRGVLVPDEITVEMMLKRLQDSGGAVIDGFPRNVMQAKALDEGLAGEGKHLDGAIYLEVPHDELMRRLSGRWICRHCGRPYHYDTFGMDLPQRCSACGGELYQRPDDAPETVKERLRVYLEETTPVLDYYRRQGKLISVSGEGAVDEVTQRILNAIALRGYGYAHNN